MNKRARRLIWMTTLFCISSLYADGLDNYPALKITPDEAGISVGGSVELNVAYIIDATTSIDTTAVWTAYPDTVISVDENGLVIGLAPGRGEVTAVLDTLSATIKIKVKADEDGADKDYDYELYVSPYDTAVSAGAQINYEVFYKSDTGEKGDPVNDPVTWTMEGMPVGSLSSGGVLTTDNYGFALIIAELADGRKGSAFIIVTEAEEEATVNKITITKTSNNSVGYTVKTIIEEGGMWTISGLPSPMNILNGGKLYFPPGSLNEDIRIHIDLPKFSSIVNDSVDFGKKGMLAGVDFQVFVDETLIEPFYFQIPFITGLVYKRGLMRKMDIDPYSMALYFVSSIDNNLEIDSSGISYVTLDLERNRIFASVAHMSTLAAIGKTTGVTAMDNDISDSPDEYRLYQNYPNPFNPVTKIDYYLPSSQFVTLSIHDVLGREVATLVAGYQESGHHTVSFPAEGGDVSGIPSGIYFYRLNAGSYTVTRKMLLLK